MVKTVSIVIPVYNDQQNLKLCLQSIYDCDKSDFEVIVVDDASEQNIKEITDDFPCRYIRLPVNGGQAHARNVGVRESMGGIILFTDSDCRVMKNWAQKISANLIYSHHKSSDVVAICGQLTSAKGFVEMSHAYAGYAYVQGGNRRAMDYLNTSCVAVLKKDFWEVGGFSEDMRVAGEDQDLALKLVERSKIVIFEPSILVDHNHGIHALRDAIAKHKRWGHSMGLSLMQKHPHKFKLLLSLLSQPIIHFLTILPLALVTTIKITVFNFKSDKRVFMYFPGILINKIFFRWGMFVGSIDHQ